MERLGDYLKPQASPSPHVLVDDFSPSSDSSQPQQILLETNLRSLRRRQSNLQLGSEIKENHLQWHPRNPPPPRPRRLLPPLLRTLPIKVSSNFATTTCPELLQTVVERIWTSAEKCCPNRYDQGRDNERESCPAHARLRPRDATTRSRRRFTNAMLALSRPN